MGLWITILSLANATYIATPENCVAAKTYPCAILTQSKSTIAHNGSGFYFSANSLFTFVAPNKMFLSRGAVWVISKSDLQIDNKYGSFSKDKQDAEFFIDFHNSAFTVSVFSGEVEIIAKGGAKSTVQQGRYNTLAAVDYQTKSCYVGNPSVVELQSYMKNFSKSFPFGLVSVEDHLKQVAKAVLVASQEDSDALRGDTARHLASVAEKENRLKLEEKRTKQLESYLRRLFRAKSNFED